MGIHARSTLSQRRAMGHRIPFRMPCIPSAGVAATETDTLFSACTDAHGIPWLREARTMSPRRVSCHFQAQSPTIQLQAEVRDGIRLKNRGAAARRRL
jgi:hypothetical protein